MAAIPNAVEVADTLLARAIDLGASDVHLDPLAGGLRVRLRVDGRFLTHDQLDAALASRLLGRLKVMAGLVVYRSDIPQEGRIELPGGREGRLAVIPTLDGESATLRLFDPDATLRTVGELGFDGDTLAWVRASLAADAGLLLVVGPSGAGKTTTLYAFVHEILGARGEFCHVTTIEDPIERRLDGCTQVQVDPIRALDFAAGLKFLLRQDPEVVMVGEIRDGETARIAVRAAMTGHLVLSSMHCGRAAEARPRLLEMGAEQYAVDLALRGVLAQRLLRRLCDACHGAGCPACLESGYRRRLVITEHLAAASEKCARTLRDAAQVACDSGITDERELSRVLGGGQ